MKLKKVKRILRLVQAIGSYDIDRVKPVMSKMTMCGSPLMLLPTKGPDLLPETREISKLMVSIKPEEIINESYKLNAAVGFPISSVMTEKNDNSIFLFMIHTAYGSISFIVTIDDAENVIGKEELSKLEHIGVM